MSSNHSNNQYKNFIKGLLGCFVLLMGITLILQWWPDVVSLFKGFIGILLALAGLLILYSLKK